MAVQTVAFRGRCNFWLILSGQGSDRQQRLARVWIELVDIAAPTQIETAPFDLVPRAMDIDALQTRMGDLLHQASSNFHKVPGSAVLIRYIQSSYQNDPVRSAIELVLVLFFIRYLLSPSYSTDKQNYVKLREDVRSNETQPLEPSDRAARPAKSHHWFNMVALFQEIEELIEDWAPEPLVPEQTATEALENERIPIIVG